MQTCRGFSLSCVHITPNGGCHGMSLVGRVSSCRLVQLQCGRRGAGTGPALGGYNKNEGFARVEMLFGVIGYGVGVGSHAAGDL